MCNGPDEKDDVNKEKEIKPLAEVKLTESTIKNHLRFSGGDSQANYKSCSETLYRVIIETFYSNRTNLK